MPTFLQILDFIGTCLCHEWHTPGLGQAVRLVWSVCGGFCDGRQGSGTIATCCWTSPTGWMTDPLLICTELALLWVILFGKHLHPSAQYVLHIRQYRPGTVPTVVGVGKSIALGYPFWVAIIMGSITGAAGGVIHDVFVNRNLADIRKEIYAMACVVGGTFYWMCHLLGMESGV